MTNKIVQKVCGFAASAMMALSGIAGPAVDVWADEPAALAGAGFGETIQPEEAPALYRITLPWTEHLIMEPETDHIFIPDPDTRTEEEKKDILLTYEAGEEVEIGIRAEETWQITKLSFLDEKKKENGYEWKDSEAVHFYMPEKNLIMKAELIGMEIPIEEQAGTHEEMPQRTGPNANAGTESIQQVSTTAEMDPQSTPQGGDHPAESQTGTADPTAVSDAGITQSGAQNTGVEAGTAQAYGNGTDASQDIGVGTDASQGTGVEAGAVQDTGSETGFSTEPGSAEGQVQNSENGTGSDTVAETEPNMTYVPEKEADGLPVQGSIEQTQTLEIVLNDAGFDAKIDLKNVSYDPEQYSVEYISDDINLETPGIYSCIYKVTAPDSGKFFFVLRSVKVVEVQNLKAVQDLTAAQDDQSESAAETTETTMEAAAETEAKKETATETVTEAATEAALETETEAVPETETETKQPSGYELDQSIHSVTSDFNATIDVYTDISSEQVIRKPIEVQKYDKDTGKPEPHNTACTFEGAEYTVYADLACTNALETMVLDKRGYAKSAKKYVIGTYYLKETKPPRGYNIDKNVYACKVVDDGSREKNDFSKVIHIDSVDEVIKGNVSIAKFFDDDADEAMLQDWINNGKLKGIRFTLTHEDPKVPPLEMTTDKYGHAETPKRSMVYGTWTIREDTSTTPEKYEALKQATFKIEIEAETLRYVVSNQLISVRLQINKKDADTGSMIPIRGAKFQILDQNGKARLNLIWNLVMGIMTAAGAIVLAWGIFEFASSYQHHDTSGRTSALKKVISGILMILGELVFQMLGGIPT